MITRCSNSFHTCTKYAALSIQTYAHTPSKFRKKIHSCPRTDVAGHMNKGTRHPLPLHEHHSLETAPYPSHTADVICDKCKD